MFRALSLVLLMAVAGLLLSAAPPQEAPAPPVARPAVAEPSVAQPAVFPAAWHGVWRGDCRNVRPGGEKMMEFPMELRVAPTDDPARTRWVIVYGSGPRRQVRDYELQTVDAARGRFRIDEKNSIVLDAYRVGDTLHQCFRVMSTLLHVRFTRRGEAIHVEMASFKFDTPTETGGEGRVPKVSGYELRTVQMGKLARVGEKSAKTENAGKGEASR